MEGNFEDIFGPSESETTNTENNVENTPVETTPEVVEAPAETSTEATPPEAETPEVQQPRDNNGRFAPKPNWVPVEALQAERQRRAEMEAKLREYEEAQSKTNRPDPFENLDEHYAYVEQRAAAIAEAKIQQELARRENEQAMSRMKSSYEEAIAEHGQEAVDAAMTFAQQQAERDDAWGRQGIAQASPVKWFLEQQTRHAEFEAYARDPQGFLAAKAAALGLAGTTPVAPAQPTQMAQTAAPRSLASTGSSTTAKPTIQTQTEAFDAIFKR